MVTFSKHITPGMHFLPIVSNTVIGVIYIDGIYVFYFMSLSTNRFVRNK
jgi:hypothetical protein